jgi:hypothetical protein
MLVKGANGGTITSIEKTSTTGLVDTYTVTMSNGDKFTFEVTNGSSIYSIEKTGTSGVVDTYTITLTNGDTTTFTVTNGTGSVASDIGYSNTASGMSADDVQEAIDELGTYKTYNVASSAWVANSDSSTSATYPYIANISSSIYSANSHPIWQMTGVGTVPNSAERLQIVKIAEAIFDTSGVKLYATSQVTSNLVLEVKGA